VLLFLKTTIQMNKAIRLRNDRDDDDDHDDGGN